MSTKKAYSSYGRLLEAPQIAPMFLAVVLASSLIHFNELLFPPQIASLNFWAIIAAYYGAFSTWFGTATLSRGRPFSDRPVARFWLMLMIMVAVSYMSLMFFAANIVDSLLSYMWGWVVLFIFYLSNYYFRYRETRLPEPIGLCFIFSSLALANAIIYSIWTMVFSPITVTVNWVFVFVAFAIIVGYRQLLGRRHAWQPVPTDHQ